MGAGPGRGPGGHGPQVQMGVLPTGTADGRRFWACERKRAYATLVDAERGIRPSQAPYKCGFCDAWHRTTRRQ